MARYQRLANGHILRAADNASIPPDPSNRDYSDFLAWQAAGNTPDAVAVVAPPMQIAAVAFLNRFTQAEQIAVQSVALANPQVAWGMTIGLAQGYISLNTPVITAWMASLVTAGAITPARATAIMTP